MNDSVLYLLVRECSSCGEEVRQVREFDAPVALDTDIEPPAVYCPVCGATPDEWFPVEEHEIERVLPTQERLAELEERRDSVGISARDMSALVGFSGTSSWANAVERDSISEEKMDRAETVLRAAERAGVTPTPQQFAWNNEDEA